VLPLFRDRDLEINHMTLKLEGDLHILKMYLHTEHKAASLGHLKHKAWIKKYENVSRSNWQKPHITFSIMITVDQYELVSATQNNADLWPNNRKIL